MKIRQNQTEIVVGFKGTGKSTYLNERAIKYPKDKKVLIIDVNGSPAYEKHRLIDTKTLLSDRWKSGVVKYYDEDKTAMMRNVMQHAKNKAWWRGGLIIFEDCTKYMPANVDEMTKAFIIDHRMINADLIFTFHSIKRIPPFFFENSHYLTIKKTAEQVESARNESIIPNYEKVLKAWQKVCKQPNNFFHITVPLGI